MERINLKKLKEALETINDEVLEKTFISHHMGLEDPDARIGLVFVGDNWSEIMAAAQEAKGYDVLAKFENELWDDAQKACAAQLDDGLDEHYSEDIPED